MNYLWFKAFHIIGVVAWFAGLFYLPRLFVYHAEATEQPEPARSILLQQFQIMEKRLYSLIMTPSLVLTLVMAIAMLVTMPDLLRDTWLHIKIAFVGVIVVYHFYCGWLMRQMAAGQFRFTGQQFRWFNEVPTVFFVLIVLLAVFKNNLPTDATAWLILLLIVAMAAIIQLYARKRRLAREQAAASTTASQTGIESSASSI